MVELDALPILREKTRFNYLFVSVQEQTFRHQVAFYEGVDDFLAATIPYLREGLEAGEPLLVALGAEKTELLRGELGADAERIDFSDIEGFGRNPARIIPAWQDFLDRHALEGAAIGRYLVSREREVARLRRTIGRPWRGVSGVTFRRTLGRVVARL